MRRFLLGLIGGGLAGAAFGFAVGIFIYPFWFLSDIVATETLPPVSVAVAPAAGANTGANTEAKTGETASQSSERRLVATGQFQHVNPNDRVHWGKGAVELYEEGGRLTVFLREDFEVGPGPAYRVYVKEATEIKTRSDFQSSPGTIIGALRAFKGSQVYPVPASVTVEEVGSVVIWCEEFSVLISPAPLNPS